MMNAFVAKTRWDVMVEGRDFKRIVAIAGSPPINSGLHRIILCARYIQKTCAALDEGSVIVKRLWMSQGYLALALIRMLTG